MASIPHGTGPRGADSKGPVVVDCCAPNPFGLYQVHGNVFEWTEDCFNKRFGAGVGDITLCILIHCGMG